MWTQNQFIPDFRETFTPTEQWLFRALANRRVFATGGPSVGWIVSSLDFSQMIHNPEIKVRCTLFISPFLIKFQSQTKMALFTQFWPSTTLLLLLGWQTKTNSNRAHHSQRSLCQTYGEESSWPIVGKMENATCQNWNVTINAILYLIYINKKTISFNS